jgi:hypothetical protein
MGESRGEAGSAGTEPGTEPGANHPSARPDPRVPSDLPELPDLNPLRAAGWIFRGGACIEIERQSEEVRTRVLAD